jgi:AcrR family transcriptional regulator
MDITRLPKNLVVLYEPRDMHRRGPRPALTVDAVVQAAIEIADAEGLAAVSMSRIAQRLGFTTMSLYRYVRSKDELLVLMADRANAEEPPAPTPASWRDGLEAWTRALFAAYRRHPWLLQIPMSGPPAGPSQLAWMEAGVQNLAEAGLHEGRKLQIIQLLHGYARGEAQLSTELDRAGPDDTETRVHYGDIVRAVTDPQTHPALTRMVATGMFDMATAYDEDMDFGFGLSTILDGVAQLVGGRVSPPPASPARARTRTPPPAPGRAARASSAPG